MNTKTTSVVITRAKGTGHSREKISRHPYQNQVSSGLSPKTHHTIWPKPAQNRPLCTRPYLSKFRFSQILKEVRPVELRGETFPAMFFSVLWVGFTDFETPCDVPGSIFGLHLRHFFYILKTGESSTSRISRALEYRPQKWLVKLVPPIFIWRKTFFRVCWS